MKKLVCLLLAVCLLTIGSAALAIEETIRTPEMGVWKLRSYVDEFNLPTGRYFVVSDLVKGTFSNSATNNSELSGFVYYMPGSDGTPSIAIRLFEYGSHRVNNPYSTREDYDIVMMDAQGKKYFMEGCIYSKGADIDIPASKYTFVDGNAEQVIAALRAGGTVRFSIKSQKNMDQYLLVIEDATGFDVAYQRWHDMQ